MPQAVWNGIVLARSDETVVVEGNHYFPPESVDPQYLRPSKHTTVCGWKGTANYCDIVVDSLVNENATWYYPEPLEAASKIKDHYAFWRGVAIEP